MFWVTFANLNQPYNPRGSYTTDSVVLRGMVTRKMSIACFFFLGEVARKSKLPTSHSLGWVPV